MKQLLSYSMIAVLSGSLLTGCGILDQEPYLPPLVKVKCRDSKTSQSLPVKTRQKKEITQSVQAKIPVNSETPVPKQPIITCNTKINASLERIMTNDKPFKMLSKIIDIAPAMNIGVLLKNPASAQKNHFKKIQGFDGGGFIGLTALLCLITGIIIIVASLTVVSDLGNALVFFFIGLLAIILSVILAFVGIFSDNHTDIILSVITVLLLCLLFILTRIL